MVFKRLHHPWFSWVLGVWPWGEGCVHGAAQGHYAHHSKNIVNTRLLKLRPANFSAFGHRATHIDLISLLFFRLFILFESQPNRFRQQKRHFKTYNERNI